MGRIRVEPRCLLLCTCYGVYLVSYGCECARFRHPVNGVPMASSVLLGCRLGRLSSAQPRTGTCDETSKKKKSKTLSPLSCLPSPGSPNFPAAKIDVGQLVTLGLGVPFRITKHTHLRLVDPGKRVNEGDGTQRRRFTSEIALGNKARQAR